MGAAFHGFFGRSFSGSMIKRQQQQQQQLQPKDALFEPLRFAGGELHARLGTSVTSSVSSDGEPWVDDGQWVDGSMVLESADQLAQQVHQAWEYATEVASRPVTAGCDARSPAAEARLPARRRCSRASMLAAELAEGDTQLGIAVDLAATTVPVTSPRACARLSVTASAPGVRAPQPRPASTAASRPTTGSGSSSRSSWCL